ncbi:hypothetical protein HJC23_000806 [Cyclotella cryptica]|uniref:Uncharacterized protein n=1 Tax=Cyclotella cryptica TaxID=29204 RepID=A0ABD3Q5N2_9STRA|eukprot:CCRYP_008439-RA/>CCRYP_008439-RA protein AED:0.32 eAED:0.32 QI:734/1/1/1/0.5/0.33/3/2326/396
MQSLLLLTTTLLLPYNHLVHSQSLSVQCSCSPTQFSFRLDLSADCDSATINENKTGIDGSLCFFGEGATSGTDVLPSGDQGLGDMVQGGSGGFGPIRKLNKVTERVVDTTSHIQHASRSKRRMQQPMDPADMMRAPTSPITEVSSILFLEIDTSPELNILNQDSTYFSTNLKDGDIVSYTSISNMLDPARPLEDQLEYVPGGVMVVLFGTDDQGVVVQNTVAWGYGGEGYCESEPLEVNDSIGWIVVDDYTPAIAAFCPAVEALPPTPSPEVTVVDTMSPTVASVETISPTAEVIKSTTTSTTTTETMHMATTTHSYVMKSKSGKSDGPMSYGSGKASKLFKGKASKAMSVISDSKANKIMSMDTKAKSSKSSSVYGKKKATKIFRGKASPMSVPN